MNVQAERLTKATIRIVDQTSARNLYSSIMDSADGYSMGRRRRAIPGIPTDIGRNPIERGPGINDSPLV